MYKSPSRNQRSKGPKVKHVLQTCLLLAICFWLVYQVKHSHDKKKEMDQDDAKTSMSVDRKDEVLKLGRKDLYPRVEETADENGRHDEVRGEGSTGEEDQEEEDSKLEEEQQGDNKSEEEDDEGRGGNKEEVDDHNQENSDGESDRVEQSVGDEKEREDSQESAEKDSEDVNGQMQSDNLLRKDYEAIRNTNEAREENYKADDASSAVSRDDTQMSVLFNETVDSEKGIEHPEMIIEQMTTSYDTTKNNGNQHISVKLEDSETARNGSNVAATAHEVKESSSRNSTVAEGSAELQKESKNPTEMGEETLDSSGNRTMREKNFTVAEGSGELQKESKNPTEMGEETLDSSGNRTVREKQGDNSTLLMNNFKLDSNLTIDIDLNHRESLRLSGDSETSIPEIKSNLSARAGDSSGSSLTRDDRATNNVKDDETGVVNEGWHEATS